MAVLIISATLNSQNGNNNTVASLVLKSDKVLLDYQLILCRKGSV